MKRDVTKYYGANKKKRVANMLIAVLAIIAIVIIVVTIYGQNVGNFVIAVETEVRLSLSLSKDSNYANPTSRLTAKGVDRMTHATLTDIPDNIDQGDGSKNDTVDGRYFAYTFYIKNTSSMVISYNVDIIFNTVTRGADSALRVMLIKNGESQIFAKAKEHPVSEIGQPEDHIGTGIEKPYMTTPFLSGVTVLSQTENNMPKGEINKYTVVMWLEGWDNECTDDIKGAMIRMEMKFSAVYK